MVVKRSLIIIAVVAAACSSQRFLGANVLAETAQESPAPHRVAEIRSSLRRQIDTLLLAVDDIQNHFQHDYADAEKYRAEIAEIVSLLETARVDKLRILGEKVAILKRTALIANPLVSSHPILFTVRKQYQPDHHNTATLFQTDEVNTHKFEGGSAIKMIDLRADGKITTLIAREKGVIRDPDVSFDGKKILFSMRNDITDDYSLYEINADGESLLELTQGQGVSDFDPLYLPDGQIAFSSTREPKYCMCNKHIMANLFRMAPDGSGVEQLGHSTLFEGHGSLLPDGRILYDRWEYVDRNFGDAQGLWAVRPDGSRHEIYWGSNIGSPGGVIDARSIPGTSQVMCIFGSCHDRPWGALAIVDRGVSVDQKESVVRTWPADAIDRVGRGNWDAFVKVNPKYEDPFPLSDKYFLVSRMTGTDEQMGIYLLDVFGNETLLHTEGPGCYDPMPLAPRYRPPTIRQERIAGSGKGTFYVGDVYQGTHMKDVERGDIKYIRVVESPEKRFWTETSWSGQGTQWPAMNWHSFENKRIISEVPVEADGSAFFEVPSGKHVYFQVLDKDKMMVQSMRSGVSLQDGEVNSCVGCHEDRGVTPNNIHGTSLALQRKPSGLNGWQGKTEIFNYCRDVQPIFDKHCVTCHDFEGENSGDLVLAGDKALTFNASYIELWRKGYTGAVGAGPAEIQQAYSWGSHKSRLIDLVRSNHGNVELTGEELETLITWVDLNAVYYSTYACAYPDNLAGRSPLNKKQLDRLRVLTGVNFYTQAGFKRKTGPQISFARPAMSPCLAKLRGQKCYAEALAIITAGKQLLQQRPGGDMAGFVPCDEHLRRQRKYQNLVRQIKGNNKADTKYQ